MGKKVVRENGMSEKSGEKSGEGNKWGINLGRQKKRGENRVTLCLNECVALAIQCIHFLKFGVKTRFYTKIRTFFVLFYLYFFLTFLT